ncbi:MAG: hypothetical protein ACLUFI_14290 [Oscillospiraceae bacterium]
MTAMALQALAKYQDQKSVQSATDKALTWLSKVQDSKGGYASWARRTSNPLRRSSSPSASWGFLWMTAVS